MIKDDLLWPLAAKQASAGPGVCFLCGDITCGVCVSSAVTCGVCVSSMVTAAKRGWPLSARLEAGLSHKRLTSAKEKLALSSHKRG